MLIKITQNIKVLFLTNIFLMSLHLYLDKNSVIAVCYIKYSKQILTITCVEIWTFSSSQIAVRLRLKNRWLLINWYIYICAFKGWIIGCDFFHLICNGRAQVHVSRSIVWMASHYDFSGDFQLVKPIQYYCYMQKVM